MKRRLVIVAATIALLVGGALLVAWTATADDPRPTGAGKPSEFGGWGAPWKNPDCSVWGPMTSGGPVPLLDPPEPDEVFRALTTSKLSNDVSPPALDQRQNLCMQLERIAEYVDPVRVAPLIGPVQRHHAYYKCMIVANEATDKRVRSRDRGVNQPTRQVFYIDHQHLHQVGPVDDVAEPVK